MKTWPRRRRENINMGLNGIKPGTVDWIHLAQELTIEMLL